MRAWQAGGCVAVAAVLFFGCDATSRYKILSTLFDGVPPPTTTTETTPEGSRDALTARALKARRAGYLEHGPYAAKMCTACHASAASNSFVVPLDQLCFRCHDLKLNQKYVHGPLASGGCTACHDPHSSGYRYLLVSDSDSFCVRCHDSQDIAKAEAHKDMDGQPCTSCHDPHMSDKKYLVR